MKKSLISAFSLVELTVALGVGAFCLMAVFGLMPVGMQTNRNATSEIAATNIMTAVVSDLRATPRCIPTSSLYQITLGTVCTPASTPSPKTLYFDGTGQFSTLLGSNSRYQLNVTWSQTGGGMTALRSAYVKVTWPAAATPANASGLTEMFVAFDRD